MRWLAASVFAGVLSLVGSFAAPSASAGSLPRASSASIMLTARAPLTVRGLRFRAGERVRLSVSGVAAVTRWTRATRAGTLAVRFDGVTATRCDLIRVVAIGGNGSRAGLKLLPSPACLAE